MNLSYGKYGLEIKMKENQVNVLILENTACMTEMVNDLQSLCNGGTGEFILSQDLKILPFEKYVSVIVNPFELNFNERKILNKLYSQLEGYASDLFMEKEEANAKIVSLLEQVISKTVYNNIIYDLEWDWGVILKCYNVKIDVTAETLLEKLLEYIKLLVSLTDIKVLCLVNIKTFLSEDELEELYQMTFYNKIQLLLVEAVEWKVKKQERTYIIDKEMCLILK